MNPLDLQGSIVALVTPLNENGMLDLEALEALIEWHIEEGTDGIVLSGTTGEAPTLSFEEKCALFEKGAEVASGRIPIIAGVGSYDSQKSYEELQEVKKIGVDAALVIVPYYNRPTPEGCFQHYALLSSLDFPLIVYHHPGRTGIKLSSDHLARICSLSSVVALKDAGGDLCATFDLLQKTEKPILAGDDLLTLPIMASGGVGGISVVANIIPRAWKELTLLLQDQKLEAARLLLKEYYPLCVAMGLETNPQPVKYALSLMGKCQPMYRLPLMMPEEQVQRKIQQALDLMRPLLIPQI